MCGIFACYSYKGSIDPDLCQKQLRILQHRGPDQSRSWQNAKSTVWIGFNRLAIQDTTGLNSMQPFFWPQSKIRNRFICVCNGEIYNYKELYDKYLPEYEPKSDSDCEVILPLFIKFNENLEELCKVLIGEWVFLIYDTERNIMHICSDQLRCRPLFLGTHGTTNDLYVSSEIKAIPDTVPVVVFPPRSYWSSNDPENFNTYYQFPKPNTILPVPSYEIACRNIHELLTKSVKNKLNPDRDYGFLLSGGVDSSLVCSIAQRILRDKNPETKIKTFTVGFINENLDEIPPDVLAARKVAEFIGSDHHEILKNVYDGIDEIDKTIYYNESYDETTTRASVPMRIAVKYIKEMYPDICVIFSGEVADELFGSYLYFRKAPSALEFHKECVRLLSDIHMYDGLRADRVVSSVSCELRLPFFDPDLMDYVLRLPAEYRWPVTNDDIEKKILRDAFTDPEDPYLPNEILWRTKDAMSDGVGDLWKETLKDRLRVLVSLERYDHADEIYPFNTPDSQESFYFREVFTSKFKHPTAAQLIPYKWLPKFVGDVKDSSATAYFDQLEKVNRFV